MTLYLTLSFIILNCDLLLFTIAYKGHNFVLCMALWTTMWRTKRLWTSFAQIAIKSPFEIKKIEPWDPQMNSLKFGTDTLFHVWVFDRKKFGFWTQNCLLFELWFDISFLKSIKLFWTDEDTKRNLVFTDTNLLCNQL